MDQPQDSSTLTEALAVVPDPRHARGKRSPWLLLLTLLGYWLCQRALTARAIAHWLRLHTNNLTAALPQVALYAE